MIAIQCGDTEAKNDSCASQLRGPLIRASTIILADSHDAGVLGAISV